MYQKIYRCRLCKKIIVDTLYDKSYADIEIKVFNDKGFIQNRIHNCNNTDIGILEFIGIKKYANHQY